MIKIELMLICGIKRTQRGREESSRSMPKDIFISFSLSIDSLSSGIMSSEASAIELISI